MKRKSTARRPSARRELRNGVSFRDSYRAPPGPSLIINNFPLAAPGLHVYGPCRDRAGRAAGILSLIDHRHERRASPLSGQYFHRDQGWEKGVRSPAPSKFAPSSHSLSWSFYLTSSVRVMHTSSRNPDFHPRRYSVLDFRCFAAAAIYIIVAGLAVRN